MQQLLRWTNFWCMTKLTHLTPMTVPVMPRGVRTISCICTRDKDLWACACTAKHLQAETAPANPHTLNPKGATSSSVAKIVGFFFLGILSRALYCSFDVSFWLLRSSRQNWIEQQTKAKEKLFVPASRKGGVGLKRGVSSVIACVYACAVHHHWCKHRGQSYCTAKAFAQESGSALCAGWVQYLLWTACAAPWTVGIKSANACVLEVCCPAPSFASRILDISFETGLPKMAKMHCS